MSSMTKFFLVTIGILILFVAVLVLVIYIQHAANKAEIQKIKNIMTLEQNERNKKAEEIINNANKKKSDIRTGNDNDSFNSSLDVLQEFTGNRTNRN